MILCPIESPCRVTQHFGERPEIYKQFGVAGHQGVDLTGGKPGVLVDVHSPYDAVVWAVRNDPKGWGRNILLRTKPDDEGVQREIILAHLSSIIVKPGQWVGLGETVGVMGNTGFSNAPHLHLGLRYLDEKGLVRQQNNGYAGWVPFEQYLLFWKKTGQDMVTYPYDK
jgi:murein DD-endopeptidase MepM/ murein hydrolase activator NlpD